MKRANLYILLSLFSFGCGPEKPAEVTQNQDANYLPSGTVSFIQSTPAHGTQEVSLDTNIRIQFSGSINAGSLADGNTIIVRDDLGKRMPGAISYESGSNTAIWTPQYNGRGLYLNAFTRYSVNIFGVTDAQGLIIAPWDFDFYTKKVIGSSGKFHIVYIGKQRKNDGSSYDSYDSILAPSSGLEVQFSERVFENTPTCSSTYWSDAFQIINADLGNIIGTSGQVCLICRSVVGASTSDSICDTLRFTPTKQWISGSALVLKVRPSLTLKGVSGEPLNREESTNLFVFPNLAKIFQ